MGGRPRTPTNILDARGAFRNHPGRRKQRENEPTNLPPIGNPPEKFSPDQTQAWNDIVSWCAPGVLKITDRIAVEITAGLLARHRLMPLSGSDLTQLGNYLGKFGMTPAERSKVPGLNPNKPKNPFSNLE